MLNRRNLGALLTVLITTALCRCGEVDLSEPVKVDDCFNISLEMSLSGELRVIRQGKTEPIKLEASAKHALQERILAVDKDLPTKVARYYDKAEAVIKTGSDRSERWLRPERKLIVAQRYKDQLTTYCPSGALFREELELTNDHLDTLSLTGLLPRTSVQEGDTWKIPNEVVQALCGFEGLVSQSLEGKLEEIKDDSARVVVKGTCSGIDGGAAVKVRIEATCRVDLKSHRLVEVQWSQTDEREQGPINPASTIKMTTMVRREPIALPEKLDQVALVGVPSGLETPATLTPLYYHDPHGRFDLTYAREWTVVAQTRDHLIMRLMDHGDFIAQATITPWRPAEKGQHMSPTKLRELIDNTPGWEMERELQSGEVTDDDKDGWTYRVSALGRMDGVAVLQYFLAIAGPNGDQALVVFTLDPKYADKLGGRDLSLVGGLEFPQKKE